MTAAERAALDQSGAGARAELDEYVQTTRRALAQHDESAVAVALAGALRDVQAGQVRGLLMAAVFGLARP